MRRFSPSVILMPHSKDITAIISSPHAGITDVAQPSQLSRNDVFFFPQAVKSVKKHNLKSEYVLKKITKGIQRFSQVAFTLSSYFH